VESVPSPSSQLSAPVRVLRAVGLALIALGALKYLVLLAEEDFDFGRAPNFFIVLLLPIVIAVALVPRKLATIIMGIMSLVFLGITLSAIVRLGLSQQNWSDALLVFLGAPISLIGTWAALSVLRGRHASPEGQSTDL
jgi:FtsH-binding integral membrane protein